MMFVNPRFCHLISALILLVGGCTAQTQLESFYERLRGGDKTTCETYSMSHYDEDYVGAEFVNTIWGQWGHHALRWKGYRFVAEQEDLGETAFYFPFNADEYVPPFGGHPSTVECPDKDLLNDIEGNVGIGAFAVAPYPPYVDPDGIWICASEPDPVLGALTAALAMYFFKTPVYLNAQGVDADVYVDAMIAAVIERVTLCADGPDPPHVVCGWDTLDWSDSLDGVGSCSASLILDGVEFSYFTDVSDDDKMQEWFRPHVSVTADVWAEHYGLPDTKMTDLVFDPPEGIGKGEIVAIHKLAVAASEKLLIRTAEDKLKRASG